MTCAISRITAQLIQAVYPLVGKNPVQSQQNKMTQMSHILMRRVLTLWEKICSKSAK